MTKIDIFSGFLGAGKTTLIKKLLKEELNKEKVVLIENEFGEIGIDGGFLKEAGIEIKEMNSGCICCSLVGDFGTSLKEVIETYAPERILIEPSGVGKLSDVIKAVEDVKTEAKVLLNSAVVVVDAGKCKMYIKNFGEFFLNQIEHAGTIVLSRTGGMNEDKLKLVVDMIREHNKDAKIITTPWDELDSKIIIEAMEGKTKSLAEELMAETLHHHHHEDGECCHGHHHGHEHEHEHEHHHHHEDGECCHGHHHHEEGECCHGHHHDEEGECCHGHHHDHDHEHEHEHHHEDGECCHGHHHDHDHEHHHHHHADEVFSSWGKETPAHYTKEQIEKILAKLDSGEYGMILRAKGMVPCDNGTWIYFDYVPGEMNVREGKADYTGKLCVIGSKLKEKEIEELFA
ncbi:MAG: GTP-binding protein [Lachnospiraceae bacterium]|nr:GTP-binding protein [Lachnospiraceae bacterium]